jgi:hypothetical protein
VDLLKLIQLGITFADENGELAEECPTWQFNFRFSLEEDVYNAESIALLQRSGIDFASHQEKGIDVVAFGELFMSSGLVLCDNISWISFHSAYDFAYLIKLLTNTDLPRASCPLFFLSLSLSLFLFLWGCLAAHPLLCPRPLLSPLSHPSLAHPRAFCSLPRRGGGGLCAANEHVLPHGV